MAVYIICLKTSVDGGVLTRCLNLSNALQLLGVEAHLITLPAPKSQSLPSILNFIHHSISTIRFTLSPSDLIISFSLLPSFVSSILPFRFVSVPTGSILFGSGSFLSKLFWYFIFHLFIVPRSSLIAPASPHLLSHSPYAFSKYIPLHGLLNTSKLDLEAYSSTISSNLVPVEKSPFRIIYVGSLDSNKGILPALEIMIQLMDEMPSLHIHFDIYGSGPLEHYLLTTIQHLPTHIRSLISFHGHITSVASAYAQADLLLLPTRSEGFSNAILESLYLGCKVLTTNCSGNLFLMKSISNSLNIRISEVLCLLPYPITSSLRSLWVQTLCMLLLQFRSSSQIPIQYGLARTYGLAPMGSRWLQAINEITSN